MNIRVVYDFILESIFRFEYTSLLYATLYLNPGLCLNKLNSSIRLENGVRASLNNQKLCSTYLSVLYASPVLWLVNYWTQSQPTTLEKAGPPDRMMSATISRGQIEMRAVDIAVWVIAHEDWSSEQTTQSGHQEQNVTNSPLPTSILHVCGGRQFNLDS